MTLDRDARNRLASTVGKARDLLRKDVADQLRRLGFQMDGSTLDLDQIAGLSEQDRAAGEELRIQLNHLADQEGSPGQTDGRAGYDRMTREIGFTILNRLAALRLAEARGVIFNDSIRQGMASAAFQVFERQANGALGNRAETYRTYLECLFDELASDRDLLPLFDRSGPESLVFPSAGVLEDVLGLLNDPALASYWQDDETIGWIYQYYNDPEERRAMRQSAAPRTSRELAVRNQFFTPRYVVEFLTDNSLGRTWYEMQKGKTRLIEDCRYLVRRKHPIFLEPSQPPPHPYGEDDPSGDPDSAGEMWTQPNPVAIEILDIWRYALTAGGYSYAREHLGVECGDLANERLRRFHETGKWEGSFEDLRCCLFFEQRRYHHFGEDPEGEDLEAIHALYRAICERWDFEVEAILHRPKKDPRQITVLDPACGSGHFLLYAFDLLEAIYDEGYDDPDLGPALQLDYPDREEFRRAVPGLILAHNLWGIEIDPRACQIAALALWLRAHRSFQRLGLASAARPALPPGNIVCAEPMPGERDLLEEYLSQEGVEPRLRDVMRQIWDVMRLAGDAGSLLRIEDAIEERLREARSRRMRDVRGVQTSMFQPNPPAVQVVMTSQREEREFWEDAERQLLEALRDYARRTTNASNGKATLRRLFAHDAMQGMAFVDVCLRRRTQPFDVVLMNPPFGEGSRPAKAYFERSYPRTKNDVYAAFVERGLQWLATGGLLGAITSRTGFFLTSFQKWREEILLKEARVLTLADLGYGVLDAAMVETAAYVLERKPA